MTILILLISTLLLLITSSGFPLILVWSYQLGVSLYVARVNIGTSLWLIFVIGLLTDVITMQRIGSTSLFLLGSTAAFYILHHYIDNKSIFRNSLLIFVFLSIGQVLFLGGWSILWCLLGTGLGMVTSFILGNFTNLDTISLRSSSLR